MAAASSASSVSSMSSSSTSWRPLGLAAAAVTLVGACAVAARRRRRLADPPLPAWAAAMASADQAVFGPHFSRKLATITKAGAEQLVVISDFDWTMSTFRAPSGSMSWTSYGVVTNSSLVPEGARKEMSDIKNKYHVHERNRSLSMEVRSAYMNQWWDGIHEVLQKLPLTSDLMAAAIRSANDNKEVTLRKGLGPLLQLLHGNKIPTLVMSAGLSQTVEGTLRYHGLWFPDTMEVCANEVQFDDKGKCNGFLPVPPIHSLCKKFAFVNEGGQFRRACAERTAMGIAKRGPGVSAILLGDNIGDARMADGLTADEVLRVGFLHADLMDDRQQFLDAFDVAILHDGSVTAVQHIVEAVLAATAAQAK